LDVSKHGRDLEVTFYPSWLHGIASQPVEKSRHGTFGPSSCSAILDFVCEETLNPERIGESRIMGVGVQGFYNGERDAQAWIELCVGEFAIPRTRSARCSTLSEGWSCVVDWWGEGDDDGKGIGEVDEVNESDTIVVVDGDCRWEGLGLTG